MKGKTEMKSEKIRQQLLDRRAYRATLIQKREELERKIKAVESQIRDLTESKAA